MIETCYQQMFTIVKTSIYFVKSEKETANVDMLWGISRFSIASLTAHQAF